MESPQLAYLPDRFYSVDLLVVPLWGVYANMIAQLISQVSSHLMIHYHRQIVHRTTIAHFKISKRQSETETNPPDKEQTDEKANLSDCGSAARDTLVCIANQWVVLEEDKSNPSQLSKHQFSSAQNGDSDRVVARSQVNRVLAFWVFCVSTLVVAGCVVRSFSLDILGVVGVAIEFGQDFDQATRDHSVTTVMRMLMDQARFLDVGRYYVGLGTLSFLVLLTIMIVPIIISVCLLLQWLYPLSVSKRIKLSTAIETLHAWQYSEVYLLSLFVAR